MPTITRWTPVNDKKAIAVTAKTMIAAITGAAVDSFGVDLTEDRPQRRTRRPDPV
ncbi:hypothetical protein [Nocardia sp. CA-120079]|uniref:hypothetical protein n=1 Tax=Nocardia sp. CA-120079 TaxID=3239974 RepID=UPI003D98540C